MFSKLGNYGNITLINNDRELIKKFSCLTHGRLLGVAAEKGQKNSSVPSLPLIHTNIYQFFSDQF